MNYIVSELPSAPTIHDYFFSDEADAFFNCLPSLVETIDSTHQELSTEKHWVCLYCRTETNLLIYNQNGFKNCYNCGSNEGEINE